VALIQNNRESEKSIPPKKLVLIVDGNAESRQQVKAALEGKHILCHTAQTVSTGLKALSKRTYDLILTELHLPDRSGQELVKLVAEKSPSTQIIILTGLADSRKIGECMAAGAYNFLRKPFETAQLRFMVETAFDAQPPQTDNLFLSDKKGPKVDRLVGRSKGMQKIYRQMNLAASTDIHVLLMGESGTGKELVARSIHDQSDRCSGPFVAVNTGAIEQNLISSELFGHVKGAFTGAGASRKGMFETAHGGTLFLDELSTMDEQTQISLLRVLDNKMITRVGGVRAIPVDVRIIAATNTSLEDEVEAGRFREDLYHRLNVFTVNIPPLRERKTDIKMLTDVFLEHFSQKFNKDIRGIPREALTLLQDYNWPGNVRELKNSIQRAVLLSNDGMLTPEVLPDRLKTRATSIPEIGLKIGVSLAQAERSLIVATLAHLNGNKKETARILGISRKSLYDKIRRHKI
jgi:DNA-binding NtrC family response regulator